MFSECPIFNKKARVEGDGQSVSCCCNLILFTENTRYFKQAIYNNIIFFPIFFTLNVMHHGRACLLSSEVSKSNVQALHVTVAH